jgi:zinc transport system ATP-binding protein
MTAIITIEHLGYDFGEGPVLTDVNLNIEAGDFVAVIGANGAGKSTLLRLLAHILRPTTGFITLFGQPLNEFKDWQKVGYVPQNPGRQQRSFPISVREVVALGRLDGRSLLQRFNDTDEAAVNKIIEQFSLQDLAKRKIGDLSGGQQQRVFLARAMVNNPELLLLDEPATGVDPDAKVELYRMLGKLNRQEGKTIVMVSHDLELASQYAHDALCLDRSVCFWGGVHEALTHRHKHGYFYR